VVRNQNDHGGKEEKLQLHCQMSSLQPITLLAELSWLIPYKRLSNEKQIGMMVTNQNCIHKEIMSRLHSGILATIQF
jgi:hypothetical protein